MLESDRPPLSPPPDIAVVDLVDRQGKEPGSEMASIAEQRETLQNRREELARNRRSVAEQLEAARKDLERRQAELEGLTAQEQVVEADVDATTKLEQDVKAAGTTTTEVRTEGEAELASAREDHRTLTSRIDQELSAERRAALSRAMDAIDESIAQAGEAADDAADRLAEAEDAAEEARQKAAAAAVAHESAIQRLHAVPQAIEAARARVVTARGAAAAAVDAGRMAEAYVRARDLSRALDALDQAVHRTDDQVALEELPRLWGDWLARSGELGAATAAVGPRKDAAAKAQSDRDALVSARETKIEAILSEPPAAQPGEHEDHPEPDVPPEGEPGPG